MNLAIDIGNSTIKIAVIDPQSGAILCDRKTCKFERMVIEEMVREYQVESIIWLSTGFISEADKKFLDDKGAIHFLPGVTPIPIKNCYQDQTKLGADRLALAIGVWEKFPYQDSLILDFGTALTIDFLNSKGEFMGGHISPGLQIRLDSLNERTSALPLYEAKESVMEMEKRIDIPSNTQEAMMLGVYRSMLYEIEGHLNRQKYSNLIFSGNDAKYFVDKFKITIFAKCSTLLFQGLNVVLESAKLR